MKASPKRTSDPRQIWVFVGLFLFVASVFGYAVLPRIDPGSSHLQEGEPAPDFALPVVFGGEEAARVRLGDLAGRVVLLDFWASWCAPCREQAAAVDRVARAVDDTDVVVLGVATSDTAPAARAFAEAAGLGYPSVIDSGEVALAYRVTTLPTLVVVAKDGTIASFDREVLSESAIRERLLRAGSTIP